MPSIATRIRHLFRGKKKSAPKYLPPPTQVGIDHGHLILATLNTPLKFKEN
jgi:hypothetical protein